MVAIDYASGVSTELGAAVRRNLMGGKGLLVEQITQQDHDDLGCDGWEISAHANSAPDHEPIQGRQYSDAEYEALNSSLARRIGTLNCGHVAMPIILGVSLPQYTEEELASFREENARGVTWEGRHMTGYEATQYQNRIERNIRLQKRRVLMDAAAGDEEQLLTDSIKLTRLNQEYARYNKALGFKSRTQRLETVGWGKSQAGKASAAAQKRHKQWLKSIGAEKTELNTLAKYYDAKYNNSPAYQVLRRYARSVESGMLSPMTGIELYQSTYDFIESQIIGLRTSNGIEIRGQSHHFLERVFGTSQDPHTGKPRTGVQLDDVLDCIVNGRARPTRTGEGAVRSQVFFTENCAVSVNPDTGVLIQCNPL